MAILLAVYAAARGMGASVTLDVTLTMTPDRRARNCGSTACVMAMTPKVLVSNTSRTVDIGVASARQRRRSNTPRHEATHRCLRRWNSKKKATTAPTRVKRHPIFEARAVTSHTFGTAQSFSDSARLLQ